MSRSRHPSFTSACFLKQSLLVDLEVAPAKYKPSCLIGMVCGDWSASQTVRRLDAALLDGMLESGGRSPSVVMGHNLLEHDLPHVRERAPTARLLSLPVVDTSYLSPLAFPQNPYHALIKGYKLCKSSVNDPVDDSRLAGALFENAWSNLCAQDRARPGLLSFYRYCFASAAVLLGDGGGMATALRSMGGDELPHGDVLPVLLQLAGDKVCHAAVRQSLDGQHDGAPAERLLAFAYVVAWLPVSGNNSVIPQWVVRRMPQVTELVHSWRDTDCRSSSCAYCRETHDPRGQLRRYFRFDNFRPQPADAEGGGLQAQIVAHGMGGGSHLAVLPTGGGKSLCFQLPALVRNHRRGSLTIVFSPLQALMRDQIVNLREKTGARVAALYGLLTPLERGQVLREVAMGDISVCELSYTCHVVARGR